jgi:pimeloyl-ACP methyl ester carboxylesterase
VEERVVTDVRVWPPTWQKQFGQAAGEVNGEGSDLIPGPQASRLAVGQGEAARELAVLSREGASPGVFWLGGFRSDMTGTKATAVDRFAAGRGLAATRFDYSGHGRSSGKFSDGTISRWLEEALAVFDRMTQGRQVVVGSSMGGWLALLLTEARHDSGRVAGLVLVAPAFDMTRALMWDRWSKKARKEFAASGIHFERSEYSAEPDPVTRALIEDGDRHLIGGRLVETGCPVHILQGRQDRDVPWQHAAGLVSHLASDDVVFSLIRDGDHRLSRPEDIERLERALTGMVAEAG